MCPHWLVVSLLALGLPLLSGMYLFGRPDESLTLQPHGAFDNETVVQNPVDEGGEYIRAICLVILIAEKI